MCAVWIGNVTFPCEILSEPVHTALGELKISPNYCLQDSHIFQNRQFNLISCRSSRPKALQWTPLCTGSRLFCSSALIPMYLKLGMSLLLGSSHDWACQFGFPKGLCIDKLTQCDMLRDSQSACIYTRDINQCNLLECLIYFHA